MSFVRHHDCSNRGAAKTQGMKLSVALMSIQELMKFMVKPIKV